MSMFSVVGVSAGISTCAPSERDGQTLRRLNCLPSDCKHDVVQLGFKDREDELGMMLPAAAQRASKLSHPRRLPKDWRGCSGRDFPPCRPATCPQDVN